LRSTLTGKIRGYLHAGKKKQARNGVRAVAISGGKWDAQPLDKSSFTPMYFQIQTQLLR